MSQPIYVSPSQLPESIVAAIRGIGCKVGKSIPVYVRDMAHVSSNSGDGCRAFTIALDLTTGQSVAQQGSWGGANPFERRQVDLDTTPKALQPHQVVINGHTGYTSYCSITVHPDAAVKMLPPAQGVGEREAKLLGVYASLNSAGRKDYFARNPGMVPTPCELLSLATRGFLKVSKSGAVTITCDGRNNADRNIGW